MNDLRHALAATFTAEQLGHLQDDADVVRDSVTHWDTWCLLADLIVQARLLPQALASGTGSTLDSERTDVAPTATDIHRYSRGRQRHRFPASRGRSDDLALLEAAWGIIANAGQGDWNTQTEVWRDAAERWRDDYHARLRPAKPSDTPGQVEADDARPQPQDLAALREQLAAVEHQRWADWQRHVHGQCVQGSTGALTIPSHLVRRWERQIATPYAELSEVEKASDRRQVDRYWPIVESRFAQRYEECEQAERERDEARVEAEPALGPECREQIAQLAAERDARQMEVQSRDDWAHEVAVFYGLGPSDDLFAAVATLLRDTTAERDWAGARWTQQALHNLKTSAKLRAKLAEVTRQRDAWEHDVAKVYDLVRDKSDFDVVSVELLRKVIDAPPAVAEPPRYDATPTVDGRDPKAYANYAARLDFDCREWWNDDLDSMAQELREQAQIRRDRAAAGYNPLCSEGC